MPFCRHHDKFQYEVMVLLGWFSGGYIRDFGNPHISFGIGQNIGDNGHMYHDVSKNKPKKISYALAVW